MKRLLCIVSSLDTGGAETFLMKIYRTLPTDKYQMDFVVSRENGFYTQEVLSRGGKIFKVPLRTKHPIRAFYAIQRIVENNQYWYILKLTDPPIGVIDLLAAKMGGAQVLAVRSCNALTNLTFRKRVLDIIFRPILNCVATVRVAPSMMAAEYTFGAAAKEKVHLLHNAVDLSIYRFVADGRTKIRDEFGIRDEIVVGHIGRFSKQKNHVFLLETFRKILDREPNSKLLLVGTGELEQQIRQKIAAMGMTEQVIFTGVRSDIPQLLSAMDVLVFPSFHEGMPNVVIEGQATGLPCLIADTITREADITGLVQYMPLSESAEVWAQKALEMISDSRKDTRQDFIDNKYDIASVVEEFVRLCF